jgi:hypothetical protein
MIFNIENDVEALLNLYISIKPAHVNEYYTRDTYSHMKITKASRDKPYSFDIELMSACRSVVVSEYNAVCPLWDKFKKEIKKRHEDGGEISHYEKIFIKNIVLRLRSLKMRNILENLVQSYFQLTAKPVVTKRYRKRIARHDASRLSTDDKDMQIAHDLISLSQNEDIDKKQRINMLTNYLDGEMYAKDH